MHRFLSLLLLAALLTACGSVAPAVSPPPEEPTAPVAQPPAPEPEPAPPPPPPSEAKVSPPARQIDLPLWPNPGTTVYAKVPEGAKPYILTRAYAPLTLKGRTLYPVFMGERVYLFRLEGDEVYLDGHVSNAGTLQLHVTPRLLWRFPLTPGTTFELQYEHHNFGTRQVPAKVTAIEEFTTPSGSLLGARLQVEALPEQVWAVGTGVIMFSGTEIARIETGEPEEFRPLARLSDGTVAVLTGGFRIVDQEGRTLLDRPINAIRSNVWWAHLGGTDPLAIYYTHSQAEPHTIFQAYAYNPRSRQYGLAHWKTADGQVKVAVAGMTTLESHPGTMRFHDQERYPSTFCTYVWIDGLLTCTEPEEKRAETEERFAYLVTRPLDEVSWVRLFADPEVGRAAYRATRQESGAAKGVEPTPQELSRNKLQFRTPNKQSDGSWLLGGHGPRVRFTLVRHADDWRIATWELTE